MVQYGDHSLVPSKTQDRHVREEEASEESASVSYYTITGVKERVTFLGGCLSKMQLQEESEYGKTE